MSDPARPLLDRLEALVEERGRALVGICGAPGAGKSTICQALEPGLTDRGVVVPMDGFHLALDQLRELDRRHGLGLELRRGVPESFDGIGYVGAIERIRRRDCTVYVPEYRRDIENPIAGAIAVPPSAEIVVTEGNYLLLDDAPWSSLRDLLDEIWYVQIVDEVQRRTRLVDRHIRFGASPASAERRADGSDLDNARLIESTKWRADAVIVRGADGRFHLDDHDHVQHASK